MRLPETRSRRQALRLFVSAPCRYLVGPMLQSVRCDVFRPVERLGGLSIVRSRICRSLSFAVALDYWNLMLSKSRECLPAMFAQALPLLRSQVAMLSLSRPYH